MGYVGSLSYESKFTAPDTTNVERSSESIGRGRIARVISAYVANYTTANKKMIIGKRDSANNVHYIKVVKETNTHSIALDQPVILLENEKLIGIVESPTADDVLYFSYYGEQYQRVQ